MVVVRAAPGGAEQNEPAPWVGHTAVASGSVGQAAQRARTGRGPAPRCGPAPTRSVRAAAPTISDPPVNTPTRGAPSRSRKDRCSSVWPGGGQGAQRQPAEVDLVAVAEAAVVEGALPGGRGEDLRAVVGGELAGAGQEVGVQVGVGGVRDRAARAGRRPRRTARRSRDGSTARARPSPRSSR